MNNRTFKEQYLPPTIEVIEVQNEGVMAGSPPPAMSGGNGDWINNTRSAGSSTRSTVQGASPLQDIEDMINDILTVSK